MKIISISYLLVLWACTSLQAQHKLTRLWETDTTLAVPESVLLLKHSMYVSKVDGQAYDKDGKGGIAKVDLNGRIIDANWIKGLNAPTGMGLWHNRLYVADVDEVVVIDTATARIITKIPVPGAKGLNDITVDERGTVYVSDPQAGAIIRIINDQPAVYQTNVPGVNGLQAVGHDLYMVTTARLYRYSQRKNLAALAKMPKKGADGLAPIGKSDFLYTIYTGLLYYVDKYGKMALLLNTEAQKVGSADIGYDPVSHIVYVPTLFRKSIVAYRLDLDDK